MRINARDYGGNASQLLATILGGFIYLIVMSYVLMVQMCIWTIKLAAHVLVAIVMLEIEAMAFALGVYIELEDGWQRVLREV